MTPRPFSYFGSWHCELCRDCYAWMPPMDLGLPPTRQSYEPFGGTYWDIRRWLARQGDAS